MYHNMMFIQYAWLSMIGVGMALLRTWFACVHGIRAGYRYHNDMLKSVFAGTIGFFDVTPLGRILNRFSGDVGALDSGITAQICIGFSLLFDFFNCLTMIVITTAGSFLLLLAPLLVLYHRIQLVFRSTNTGMCFLAHIISPSIHICIHIYACTYI